MELLMAPWLRSIRREEGCFFCFLIIYIYQVQIALPEPVPFRGLIFFFSCMVAVHEKRGELVQVLKSQRPSTLN